MSQNHRMVGVGRDRCGSSNPAPLTKQGHLQQATQDLVQAGLEYLLRRRLHSFPGQPRHHVSIAQRTLNYMHKFALHELSLFVHVIQNPLHV